MFDKLQSLPLFIGLGVSDLMRIVELVDFDFQKYPEGTTFATQGERCDRIIYVLSGQVNIERIYTGQELLVTEWTRTTPYAVELENLWGMHQVFNHTYTFTTEGSTCSINKRSLSRLISTYDIVKTNLLSILCNDIQHLHHDLIVPFPATTEARLFQFIERHTNHSEGRKEFRIKMRLLADMIDDTRINVSNVLNIWQEAGLAELRRGVFIVHDLRKLNDYYAQQHQ